MSPQMFFFPPGSPFSHWLSPVLLHELQEAKQSARSFPPERLSQLPRLKWALRPSRRPPPTRRSSPSRSGSLASARLASPRSPRFKHRCHGVESCCSPLQHMCDFALCVSVCIHVCQPPDAGGGIKDALSPPEAAEPQHICDWSIILLQLYLFPPHLPLYFIMFSSQWLNLTSSSPFYFVFFLSFHVRSSPPLFVHVIFSHLGPPFPRFHSVSLSACVILITIHSYPPFFFFFYFPLFYSQYQNYLRLSLHLLSHGGEDKRGRDDLCLIQTLHWAPLIFSLVKCHRCVIVIKSYITGCWNVTLGGHDRSTLPRAAIFHSSASTFGREM